MQTDRIEVNTNLPVIADVQITTDNEGRFNLNALHKAHLAQNPNLHRNSKQPADWLKLEGTKQLADLISNSEDLSCVAVTTKEGRYGGTFAHELLAVNYAGWISPAFQLKVNQVFLDYRTGKLQHGILDLNNPGQLRGLLANYAERTELAESEVKRLSFENEELNEDSKALARIAMADGELCLRDAAKTLQVPQKAFFQYLPSHGWTYKQAGKGSHKAYSSKLNAQLLVHREHTVHKPDGTRRIVTQCLVTPRGLAKLAAIFSDFEEAG